MKQLHAFLQSPYGTPVILALFLVGAVAVFFWQGSDEATPDTPVAATTSPHTEASPSTTAQAARPASRSNSPFLTTHEQSTAFTPDGENLAPSFHVEMEALRQRLDASPQDTTALIRMAQLLHDGHKTEEAITYYQRYLDLHPQGQQAWLDLARSYGELGQWEAALTATEDMLEQFPDNPAALYNLGAIYANTSRLADARTTWERVATQSKDSAMKTKAEVALKRLDTMHP
ncbi:MAG TPA: tetratricopeptide repeat protein [Rhodothermales bacterium]|nr:tetratricopeptide repeat protein [Rhodothermales bacterium]